MRCTAPGSSRYGHGLPPPGWTGAWLAELVTPSGYVPDLLNPAPTGPAPALEAELTRVLAAPADQVRHDLDRLARRQGGLGPRLRTLYAEPQVRLARVVEEIETYWELALAPYRAGRSPG
jgi:hypothetical protein